MAVKLANIAETENNSRAAALSRAVASRQSDLVLTPKSIDNGITGIDHAVQDDETCNSFGMLRSAGIAHPTTATDVVSATRCSDSHGQ